jgi:hypothetical protein
VTKRLVVYQENLTESVAAIPGRFIVRALLRSREYLAALAAGENHFRALSPRG